MLDAAQSLVTSIAKSISTARPLNIWRTKTDKQGDAVGNHRRRRIAEGDTGEVTALRFNEILRYECRDRTDPGYILD